MSNKINCKMCGAGVVDTLLSTEEDGKKIFNRVCTDQGCKAEEVISIEDKSYQAPSNASELRYKFKKEDKILNKSILLSQNEVNYCQELDENVRGSFSDGLRGLIRWGMANGVKVQDVNEDGLIKRKLGQTKD